MPRLFLVALALLGFGVAMAGSRARDVRAVPAAPLHVQPAALPTVAYRPGEPALMLDDVARLTRGANGHFTAVVTINGQATEMLVDTGASVVALAVPDAQRLGIAFEPAQFQVVGTGASGPVKGQQVTLGDVAIGGRHVAGVEAVVLEGLDRSLLGQSYLRRLDRVAIDGDVMTLR